MRVITGKAKGRKLKSLEGNDVRPTTDKVKEAIFSAIQFEIEGAKVLDLFAGSGQLGIEALSRGAGHVMFVDKAKASCDVVYENLKMTGMLKEANVATMDSIDFLKSTSKNFDIAFLDPPYRNGLLEKAMPLLAEKINDSGKVICEHEKELVLPEKFGKLRLKKVYRYGKISVSLYFRDDETEEEA